jgi:hypothetical protein
MVYATIELINAMDVLDERRHMIGEEGIRRMDVRMLVGNGAYMLCINENIQSGLQLPVRERRQCEITRGKWLECDVVGPVEIRFGNRSGTCSAYVLPGDSEPLLGSIPFGQLDVVIDVVQQEMVVNPRHPEGAMHRL